MSQTRIQDIIVPEVFADYVVTRTAELSALYQSGVATTDPVIQARAAGGGALVNLPFFNDLDGNDEVMDDVNELTLNAITARDDVAVKMFRAKAWATTDLVGLLAGADPIQSLANRVADYWNRQEQKVMFATLEGVFSGALSATHVLDASAHDLDASVVLDGKQLLGDNGGTIAAIAMNSVVYTKLQKQNLIVTTVPASNGLTGIKTYLGYQVIVDDGCPTYGTTDKTYATYLFAQGAVAHCEVPQPHAIEFARYATKNQDVMISRSAFINHIRGVKWAVTDINPDNAALATAGNWAKVYQNKQIRVVKIISK